MQSTARQARLTPEQFKALAKYKGWKFKMLAERWGVSPEWISHVSRDPQRDLRFDDALLGLPNLNRLTSYVKARERQLNAALSKALPKRSKPRMPTPGYRYRGYLEVGTLVIASAAVGSMAEEGERGIVFQLVDDGKTESYGVIFETGMWDWFPPDYVDACLSSTGLLCHALADYRFSDERRLQQDFAGGLFDFTLDPLQE